MLAYAHLRISKPYKSTVKPRSLVKQVVGGHFPDAEGEGHTAKSAGKLEIKTRSPDFPAPCSCC